MKFGYIQQFFFFGLLFITSAVFVWMLGKYLLPVFWAIVLAVVFYPLYLRLEKSFKGYSSLASLVTILMVILIVVLPLFLIGGMVVQESVELYQSINSNRERFDETSLLARIGEFTSYLEPYGLSQKLIEERVGEAAVGISRAITSSLVAFSQMTFIFIIHVAITFYLLFFFLRDGQKLQKLIIHYLPLGDVYEKRLLARFSETTRAVVKGTITIAILQGLAGGLTFWFVGVSNSVLWGVAMGVLAIIPAVGPALVWLPAGIILIATGSLWSGVIILVVGVLLVSLVDEFLRPILVGRGSKMPDALVLLATVGGLATFGITGFVIGPILAAFFLSLWTIFEERYHGELTANDC